MNKKVLAAACLMSLAFSQAVYADDYVTGESRFRSPDFKEQKQEREAKGLQEKSQRKKEAAAAEPMPITLWSDDATYNQNSGDFVAEGNVKIVQGKETLLSTRAEGNLKTGDMWLKQGGTLEEPDTTMTGGWVYYNFNSKTGEIKKIDGKSKKDFFRAPHAIIDHEKIVADEGGELTRCPAVKNEPCLLVRAGTFEVYPNDKMIAKDVKVYVKGKLIYTRDTWVNRLDGEGENKIMPRIGYNDSDNGVYVKLQLDYNLSKKTNFYADLAYYSKAGYKPMYGINHDERNFNIKVQDGWAEEDNEWIKKQRDVRFNYKNHRIAKNLPLSYSAYASHGLWRNEKTGVQSWHTEYAGYLNHDRIYLFNSPNTFLDMTIGKKWVKESETDETNSTMMYYATLGQKISTKWDTWVGYYRENRTSNLYDYGQPDMDTEIRNGLRYTMDDKNTFTIVNRYDASGHKNYETDYRWTHRFCCWSLELEYEREYRNGGNNSFRIRYNFLNW